MPVNGTRITVATPKPPETRNYLEELQHRILGQPCIAQIPPYLDMIDAQLNPQGRPAGIFLLLGPTGTGKTRTVEAVTEILHGNSSKLLRIDCGEYQMEHEVAKLVGAPPGYLGHKETQAALSQPRLSLATSSSSAFPVILFDEIEKAAPSMQRILLGILDKGFLRTGDNNPVLFEKTLIFMTSNIGYAEIGQMRSAPGFLATTSESSLTSMVEERLKRRFAPEFLNRIDELLYFEELSKESLYAILEVELLYANDWLTQRWGIQSSELHFDDSAKELFIQTGFEAKYGARPLKRAITHLLWQPLASLKVNDELKAGVPIYIRANGDKLAFSQAKRQAAT